MKKMIVFLLVCSLTLVVAGSAFGFGYRPLELDSDTIKLHAFVKPYACVDWVYADMLIFSGRAHDTEYGKAVYKVESNCPIIAKTEGGDFRNGRYKLDTEYKAEDGWRWHGAYDDFTSAEMDRMGKDYVDVFFKAKTKGVSDQPAGCYETSLTTTVYFQF